MYLALYRKWRPKSLDDVIGQSHITITLKQEVANNRTAHAYLFTGPRGTGKTTCSRILAMALNCENQQDGNPCMECECCKGIEQGSMLDVVEIDAASNNGVDNIRQLRDEASFTPTQGKYRVYIIDEVHMLSIGAFNALLKIMEEPPSHVVFILATTEAHKVPATILSRCQRFDFRRIKVEDIASFLLKIAGEEKISLSDEAATMLARLADGGMRDALSLLDQCIAYSKDIDEQTIINAIGIVGKDYLYNLTDHIINKDATEALLLVDELYSMSKDLQSLLEELIFHIRNIMLTKALKTPESIVSVLPNELERLKDYAQKLTLQTLLYDLAEMQDCLDKMGRSVDRRLCFELMLVKLCAPAPIIDNDQILARLDKLEKAIKQGVSVVASAPSVNTASRERTSLATSVPEPVSEPTDLVPLMEWGEVLEVLSKENQPLWGALHGSSAQVGGGFLYIENALSFVSDMLRADSNAKKLVDTVAGKTGVKYKIRVKKSTVVDTSQPIDLTQSLLEKANELGVQVNEN